MTQDTATTAQVEAESFICPSCGGGLHYDGKKDKFLCASCGYEGELHGEDNSVDEWDFGGYAQREAQSVPFPGLAVASCQNCGAQITFEGTTMATTCPMCGSTQFAKAKQQAGLPPEGIIPFRVDKQEAAQKLREWVKGRWFAPKALKTSYQEGKLTGEFIPFWTYDAQVTAPYTGEGGRYRKVKDKEGKERTETDWFPTAGVVSHAFDDVLVCASTSESAKNAELVAPYDTAHNLRPYAPEYLAGYRAELYSLKADAAFETAKNRMEIEMRSLAESDIRRSFDTTRFVQVSPRYKDVTYKHVLLPVWSSVFSYKGETYRYALNGVTGEISGQRPYSIPKILAAVAVAAAVLFGLFSLFMGGDDSEMEDVSPQAAVVAQALGAPPAQQAYLDLVEQAQA